MRPLLIAVASLLASCKDKPREAPPATAGSSAGSAAAATEAPSASASQSPDVCRISLAALEQAACATPEAKGKLLGAKQSIDSVVETVGKIGGGDPRQFHVMCAQMLLAIEQDATKLGCTVALDARQRKDLTALLDAWYGQRTPVVPTGDAAADAVIARIAALRDATCEWRDGACLDRLEKQAREIGTMPASAPDAARTLGGKLLQDAERCASRARTLTPR